MVRDQTGAAITGAEVTIVSQATGDRRTVTTDETGRYVAPLLPPGSYHVSIAVTGFERVLFPNVRVVVTETTAINAEVTPASVVESVTVRANALLVHTDDLRAQNRDQCRDRKSNMSNKSPIAGLLSGT